MWAYFGIHALILVAIATLNSETVAAQRRKDAIREDVYPPLWDSAPENLLDFPVEGNKIVINAWNYQERLGVYKNLLNSSAKYFTAFGSQNFGNILWGLPLQHGWQFHTGRLADPSGVTSCGHEAGALLCISVRSWWACMNYYLAIIPFLGAVEAGLFGELPYEIEILPPEEQRADFCYSVADCRSRIPKLMDEWKAYFEVNNLIFSYFSGNIKLLLLLLLLLLLFVRFRGLKYLSDPEANFGEDWASGVDFIAATHFSTDLQNTKKFQALLPQRMLVEGDVIPFISDFSLQQNKILLSLSALHKTNQLTGGLLLKLWQKAMSTEAGREVGRKLLEDLAASRKFNPMGIYNDLKGGDLTAPTFLTKSNSNTD
uniref:Chromosome 6 open reading frame 58 n=1 Tax=Apteryx owenii TaxID=8824 RepID=A0A8B9P3N7_APTOW